jgi:hypothetical protein
MTLSSSLAHDPISRSLDEIQKRHLSSDPTRQFFRMSAALTPQ